MDVLNELCEFFKWKAASCEDEAKSWLALAARLDPKPPVKESTISLLRNAPASCVKMTYSQMDKLKDIIEGLECQLDEILQQTPERSLAVTQAEREIRQALERVRRLKDGETMTYEAVEKEEPVI